MLTGPGFHTMFITLNKSGSPGLIAFQIRRLQAFRAPISHMWCAGMKLKSASRNSMTGLTGAGNRGWATSLFAKFISSFQGCRVT